MGPLERLREIQQWLQIQISLEAAEARYAEFERETLAFRGTTGGWMLLFDERIRRKVQPGDEIWQYDTGAEWWLDLQGERGIALVRNGEVVSFLMETRN